MIIVLKPGSGEADIEDVSRRVHNNPAEALSAGLCIVAVVVAVNLLGERLSQRNEERR